MYSFIHLLLSLYFFFLVSFLYLSFFVSLLCSCFLFFVLISVLQSRVSMVGDENTVWTSDEPWFDSRSWKSFLSSLKRPDGSSVPASFQINAFLVIKRLGRVAYHSAHLVQRLRPIGIIYSCRHVTHRDNLLSSFFPFSAARHNHGVALHLCSVMRYKSGRLATTCPFWRGLFTEAHYPNYPNQLPQPIERPLFTSLSALFR